MGETNRFTRPEHPAKNIAELYQALDSDGQHQKYVYRGQVREYSGPLLPSMYRPFFTGNDMAIDASHPLFKYSIRNCGRRFLGDHNFQISRSVSELFIGMPLKEIAQAKPIFDKALNGKDIAAFQIEARRRGGLGSWFDSLTSHISKDEQRIFQKYYSHWKPCIDRYHRRMIRMFFFYFLFGYSFGTLLSQQYGLNSGCLDATTDLKVATFFATHDHTEDYAAPKREGVGIIYRFPYEVESLERMKFGHGEYYSLPPMIDVIAVVKKYLNDWGDIRDMTTHFVQHGQGVYMESEEKAADWTFPQAALKLTRFWRQAAVLLLPDELRKDLPGRKPGVAGVTIPSFEYVEDLSTRDGMEKYYFKHSRKLPPGFSLRREYLWPRDDPYLSILAAGITAVYPLSRFLPGIIPYRLDLIDPGYKREEFLHLCEKLALNNSIEFFQDTNENTFLPWTPVINF